MLHILSLVVFCIQYCRPLYKVFFISCIINIKLKICYRFFHWLYLVCNTADLCMKFFFIGCIINIKLKICLLIVISILINIYLVSALVVSSHQSTTCEYIPSVKAFCATCTKNSKYRCRFLNFTTKKISINK